MCHSFEDAGCGKWLQYVPRAGGVRGAELSESRAAWWQGCRAQGLSVFGCSVNFSREAAA